MVEAIIALSAGGLLAFLLAGPRAGRPRIDPVPPDELAALATRIRALPPVPLLAPPATVDPAAAPRKATQTARKFN